MATVIYEIPNSVKEIFEQGENSYRIIDYSISEMDNIQSMQYFLDCIDATTDNIETDDGTQVVIIHPNFEHKLVIDSVGLGDFYSHGYDVTIYYNIENDNLKTESNNPNVLLYADNFTGYFDDNNRPIFVGDKLKSDWNYEVIVVKDEDGDYSGKLICDHDHSCKNIPYALNKGKGYSKII